MLVFWVPSDIFPEVGSLGQKTDLFFIFWGIFILCSKVAAPVCIPTSSAKEFPFLHIFINYYYYYFYYCYYYFFIFNPHLRTCLLVSEREEGGDRASTRNIDVRQKHRSIISRRCPDRHWTRNPLLYRMILRPTEPPGQGSTHIFIHSSRTVATVVSLLLQPAEIHYHQGGFGPKAPAAPRYFYTDLRITQKAFREDFVVIIICTYALRGRNKASKQTHERRSCSHSNIYLKSIVNH